MHHAGKQPSFTTSPLFTYTTDLVAVLADGVIVAANPAMIAVVPGLIGQQIDNLIHSEDWEQLFGRLSNVPSGGPIMGRLATRPSVALSWAWFDDGEGHTVISGREMLPREEYDRSATREIVLREKAELETRVAQAEDFLDSLINAMPDFIYVVDRSTAITYCNDEFAKIIGYTRREDVEDRLIDDVLSPDLAAYLKSQVHHVFSTGEPLHVVETLDLPGGRVHTDTYKIPLTGSNGEVIALVGSSRDITELIDTRTALAERTADLERINHALREAEIESETALEKERELHHVKNRFLWVVAHEFRTPLTVISLSIDLLDSYFDIMTPDKRQDQLVRMRSQLKRLGALIDEIGYIHRLQTGGFTLRVTPVDLPRFLRAIANETELVRGEAGRVTITSTPAKITAALDETLMQQVFSNLISNALKYSGKLTPVSVRVEVHGSKILVAVEDSGIGISSDELNQVFQPFFRGSETTGIPGTGLGLTIVKQSVEAHGGTIRLDSVVGKGTTVTVELPLVVALDQIVV
ncbi:MAG: multi-sensor signal transduction histidine kinase [Chloroflexi bacterium OLB13]|nr:MAG: multi-sensor signal transduction histidine kinase [Chloroflexi bacterium OLB13]